MNMQAENAAEEVTTDEVIEQPAMAEASAEVADEAAATEETSTPDGTVSAA